MKRPTPSALRTAAQWLDYYDDESDEETAVDCRCVAAWLEEQADAAELRAAARDVGLPVAKVRAAMALGRK